MGRKKQVNNMKACPFTDVTVIQSKSGYFYLRTQITHKHWDTHTQAHTAAVTLLNEITAAQTLTQHAHRCKQRQFNTHAHIMTHYNQIHAWDKNQCTNMWSSLWSSALSFTMAQWPFRYIPHRQKPKNNQRLHGMKRDYAPSAANQMSEQKNCIRWDK